MNSIIVLTSTGDLVNYDNVIKVYTKRDDYDNYTIYFIERNNSEIIQIEDWRIKQFIIQ